MSGKTFTVRRGMTAIPNETIYGKYVGLPDENGDASRLSIQSLGLLLLLLSRPSGRASMGYRAFQGQGMGRDALLKAFRELEAAGLRFQFKRRSPGGSIITDTVVSEVPMTKEEAEEEWLAQVRRDLGGFPKPVDNSPADRAPENGATGQDKGSTVRGFTGARLEGASTPRGVANSSSSTSYLEEKEDINAGAHEGHHEEPGDSTDDATPKPGVVRDGPGYRAYRKLREEQEARAAAGLSPVDQKEVAPLRPMTGAGPELLGQAHQIGARV